MIRGPAVFLGYVDRTCGYSGIEPDGCFHTRDLVRVDEEGYLFLCGRRDRTFKVGDRLVNPASIERVLMQAPGVIDARCRPVPHEILGNVVAASVVTLQDANRDAILRACRERLDAALIPRQIDIVDTLVTGPTGKRIG